MIVIINKGNEVNLRFRGCKGIGLVFLVFDYREGLGFWLVVF